MLALSIKEPWCYAIFDLDKPVENRTWPAPKQVIGQRIYIHASKSFDYNGYRWIENEMGYILPMKDQFELGGIVGSVEIVACVKEYNSGWFFGPYGFVLKNPMREKFSPCRGQLGFFEVGE